MFIRLRSTVARLGERITYYFVEKPWPTNIAATVISIGVGDIIAQQAIEGRGFYKHDWLRTGQSALIGGVVIAPSLMIWYKILNGYLVRGTSRLAGLSKVVFDQALYSPYILAAFFVSLDVINKKSIEDVKERFSREYYSTLMRSYQYWPFAQTINFVFIAAPYRILFLRFMALIWNSYLCWSVHRHANHLKKLEEEAERLKFFHEGA